MTAGLAAMLAGVFVVPTVLLWLGHRIRRRSPVARGAFWGALIAHVVVAPIAMVVAMYPAAEWASTDVVRGALGFWSLLVAPVCGASIGAVLNRRAAPAA